MVGLVFYRPTLAVDLGNEKYFSSLVDVDVSDTRPSSHFIEVFVDMP